MHPLITIVTVCYNSEKTIANTVESVIKQDLKDVEYLIIDGASTDKTLSIIQTYQSVFQDKLRIISEPDHGWYDAMNKGIMNAQGDFIIFLNSDDYLDDHSIDDVEEFINSNRIKDDCVIYGDSTNVYQDSKGKKLYRRIIAPESINRENELKDGMCGIRHQSMFTGKAVFQKIGTLNLKYHIHADWDFLIRCVKNSINIKHIKRNIVFYSMYGVSTRPNYVERHKLRKENHLYKIFDANYLKDRWGIKIIMKQILGEKNWNDFLFWIHEQRKRFDKNYYVDEEK